MAESLMPPIGQAARWSPKRFVTALLAGKTYAQSAKIAGARGTTDDSLRVTAQRWLKTERVRSLLRDASPVLDEAWAHGTKWACDVLAGRVEATNLDRNATLRTVGQALGQFVQRVEVTHSAPLKVKGFRTRVVDAEVVERAALEGGALGGGDAGDGGEEP
jgi:phage terminase small subunit